MRPFFRYKSLSFVGVEIQDDAIRLVRLLRTKERYQIVRYARVGLPSGAINEGKIYLWDSVRDALRYLIGTADVKGHTAATAIPAHAVLSKRIRLAKGLSELTYEAAIRDNLDHYFPGMGDDVLQFDFAILGSTQDEHEVLLVAARQEIIQSYVTLLQEAGLSVNIVDIDSYALARCARLWIPEEQTAGVLKWDTKQVTLSIFAHQDMLFCQQWPYSGGIGELLPRIERALRPFQPALTSLHLAGSKNNLEEFSHSLQAHLGINIVNENPFNYTLVASELNNRELGEINAELWVSCGLALRGLRC